MQIASATLATAFLCISIASAPLRSQTARQKLETFEVAVVKPSNLNMTDAPSGGCHGTDSKPTTTIPIGRCIFTGQNLKQLLMAAYYPSLRALFPPDQLIIGGPHWTFQDRFNIEAKAEDRSESTNDQLLKMLGTLLAARFKLQIHHDTKQFPGFSLIQARGGGALQENPKDCTPGGIRIGGNFGITSVTGICVQPDGLAKFLTYQLQAPVQDRTNLTGAYDFHLEYTPSVGMPGAPPTDEIPGSATIFTAIQEQLGLRLVSTKVPVDVVVIDSVQKPTAN